LTHFNHFLSHNDDKLAMETMQMFFIKFPQMPKKMLWFFCIELDNQKELGAQPQMVVKDFKIFF
jgi:hypothetical protein